MTFPNWSACRQGQARPAAPFRIIRMPASKPWRRPERPPPVVFRVDQAGFRELVHQLTGAPPPHPIMPVTEAGFAVAAEICACRVQKYVGEGREDRQRVWASPADPANKGGGKL